MDNQENLKDVIQKLSTRIEELEKKVEDLEEEVYSSTFGYIVEEEE